MRYLILGFILLFSACATKEFATKESKIVIIKSPKIRFGDIGYIKHDGSSVELELFSAGNAVMRLEVGRLVCVEGEGCMRKHSFNEEYLNAAYPDELLEHILMGKPIFEGRNLQRTKDGFVQRIKEREYDIKYSVTPHETLFKDKKNRIIFKLKDIE